MAKYYYKRDKLKIRRAIQILSGLIFAIGAGIIIYIFFPLLSWQVYFAPVFAAAKIEIPIPKTTVVSASTITTLVSSATNSLGRDYTNAMNWYPTDARGNAKTIPNYTLSIPAIELDNVEVSTQDTDLTKHTVQYNYDSIPPNEGNSIIFGHSTLPQLFNKYDYKTIFANAYKLKVGDKILVNMKNATYQYKIQSIIVVEPEDTSVLAQDTSDSFITIITCTPPGTIWKRLVIKARIESI